MDWKKSTVAIALAGVTATGGVAYGDAQINPYEDKGAHFELPIVSDIPQGERVEIAKDRAAMTLKGWNDEYAITIEPQIPTAQLGATDKPFTVEANRPLLSQRMEYKQGDVTAFIEPKSANEFDIDFTLDAKPDTNVFTYKIDGASDFDFFYQPELTAEEIAEGASRPDNVVGSYAVYHKTKANHQLGSTNYATGKAFHIYRPKAIDANGAEVWADLNYDSSILSVTVPQKFLAEAVYPIRVDPTFGYTGAGVSSIVSIGSPTSDTSRMQAVAHALDTPATLDQISMYLESSGASDTADLAAVIYREDSAGSGSHDKVLEIQRSDVTVTSSEAWYTFTGSSQSLSVDTYILAAIANGEDAGMVNGLRLWYDSGGTSRNKYTEVTTGAGSFATRLAEDPWTAAAAADTNEYSIYVTYSCSDPGVPGTYSCIFTTAGYTTWTVPTGVTSVDIACWGGGGAGFDGTTGGGGAGGGGGAFASSTETVSPSDVIRIFVGSGGSTSGAAGATSTASTTAPTLLVSAPSGGGAGGVLTPVGGGGKASLATGDVSNDGGNGGTGIDNGNNDNGGGGGGAAGPHGDGNAGQNGQSLIGGDGGVGDVADGGTAGQGGEGAACSAGGSSTNGGGGGGGGDNGLVGCAGGTYGAGGGGGEGGPGAGAAGACTITYTIAAAAENPKGTDPGIIWFSDDSAYVHTNFLAAILRRYNLLTYGD